MSESIKFMMVGHHVKPSNTTLVERINGIGLQQAVMLLGEVDTSIYVPVLDVMVSCSWSEAFPNVLGEALSCGVPCVATDVGDTKEIIGDNGFVVPVGDMDQLAHKVVALLKLSTSDYDELSQRGRQHIITHYSIEKMAAAYGELYKKVSSN